MKDLFAFDEEIARKDSEFFIESLAVDSLFPNIPLEETNKICCNTVFEILKKSFKNNFTIFIFSPSLTVLKNIFKQTLLDVRH